MLSRPSLWERPLTTRGRDGATAALTTQHGSALAIGGSDHYRTTKIRHLHMRIPRTFPGQLKALGVAVLTINNIPLLAALECNTSSEGSLGFCLSGKNCNQRREKDRAHCSLHEKNNQPSDDRAHEAPHKRTKTAALPSFGSVFRTATCIPLYKRRSQARSACSSIGSPRPNGY